MPAAIFSPTYLSRRAIERNVSSFLGKLSADATVLDIGCGHSPYRKYAACSYIGVDTDVLSGADVVYIGDTIPLDDALADAIICTQTLQHVTDVPNMMREMYRLLKPGGEALISVPFIVKMVGLPRRPESEFERRYPGKVWRDDFWRFTPFGLMHVCADFDIVSVIPTSGYAGTMIELFQNGVASVSTAWPLRLLFAVGNMVGFGSDWFMDYLAKRVRWHVFQMLYRNVYGSVSANYILLLKKVVFQTGEDIGRPYAQA